MEQMENAVDLAVLKEKCLECGENNLAFYCDALRKVYQAFRKMEETEMLSYAKQIIAPAFPNIVVYFEDRVNACMEERPEKQKALIREDVEHSIVEFCEMFDTIIHSTNMVDQILFQTAPLHTGIRYTAPKLCAYYSQVLNQFARILQDNKNDQYAFCVYPTLNSKAQAVILFETMEKTGKVCVIRVPGHQIAAVDRMLLLLFHELFHILPGEGQRRRRERAGLYWQVLLYAMTEKIYSGCKLSSEEVGALDGYFISSMAERLNRELLETVSGDRRLYSRHLQERTLSEFLRVLQRIGEEGIEDYKNILYKGKNWNTFTEYRDNAKRVKDIYGNVRKNVQVLLINNRFISEADFYMKLFREPFADMLTILLLRLSPAQYFNGVGYQEKNKKNVYGRDLLGYRMYFVVKTLMENYYKASDEQKRLLDQWKNWQNDDKDNIFVEYFLKIECMLKEEEVPQPPNPAGAAATSNHRHAAQQEGKWESARTTQVIMNSVICEKYLDYFRNCCAEFLEMEREKSIEFQKLRDNYGLFYNNHQKVFEVVCKRKWELATTDSL